MNYIRYTRLSLCAAVMFLPSCSGSKPDSPPKISYGKSPCDECRMIISDEASAAAVIGEGDDGPNTPYRFDDIGCMIHFM